MPMWRWAAAASLLVGACSRSTGSEQEQDRIDRETALARQDIEATNQRFTMHVNAGNGDSAAVIFAERGRAMWPNAPAAIGHVAIAAEFDSLKRMSPTLSLRTEEVAANGLLAVERGRYTMSWTPPGGAQVADSGKYLARWHKMAQQWRIVDFIWNSDLPAVR
jgi:ketosteroid isomerase-like protein